MKITAILAVAGTMFCASAPARTRLAPADEYFGRMKMSVLEIGNRLHDLNRRSNAQDRNVIHDAGLTEDAMHDWERKYPADPWLFKDIASLVRIYAHLNFPDAQQHARSTKLWLTHRYAYYRALLARHITH